MTSRCRDNDSLGSKQIHELVDGQHFQLRPCTSWPSNLFHMRLFCYKIGTASNFRVVVYVDSISLS